jgi:penicillin amidase
MKAIVLSRPLGRLKQDIVRGFGNYATFSAESSVYESNEWVVAPEKTADGYAMLQTDPHLSWFGMNSWYEVAWTMTANSPDTADAYIETIKTNPYQYRYNGQWLDIEVINEIIEVAGEDPVEVEFFYTHHGPIVYQEGSITLSGKMSTWEQVGVVDQILAYNRAQNLDDFKDALSMLQCVRWNHVYGDADGNIFYIWNARVFMEVLPIQNGEIL